MYPKTFCQFLCCSPHSVLAVKLLHIHVHRCQVFLATTKNLVTLVMVVQSEHTYHNYGSYACTQVSHNLGLLDGFLIWAQAYSKDQVHVHTASSAACNVLQWRPSITDTIGNQNFVCNREVSLTKGLSIYYFR